MANILCLETATTNCSVAIGVKGTAEVLIEEDTQNYSHSEQLHVFVDRAIEQCPFSINDIDAIAVSMGPGSYTGLRIGVSAAKGLCFALDVPLIAIPTLESMANQIGLGKDELVIPLLDARRMEVYSSVFDSDYNNIRETKAEIITEESFNEYLHSSKVHLVGNGSEKCQGILKSQVFSFQPKVVPSAGELVALAENKYKIGDFVDVAYFEPFYLKDFVMQRKKKN